MQAGEISEVCVGADNAGGRLDVWLAGVLDDCSRSRVQSMLKGGQIRTAEGAVVKAHDKAVAGMRLVVERVPPAPAALVPEAIPLEVIHEDADLIVLNKPAGLVVHPAPGHPRGTLVNALLFHCDDLAGIGGEQRPGIVHRLDRDTSGVMVVAKRESAMASLSAQFQRRSVAKTYAAILYGIPHPGVGRIETLIGRSPHDRKKMTTRPRHGREAVTNYRLTEAFDGFCRVMVGIETGRTHQIRVHMAHIGHGVVGDAVYGRRRGRPAPPIPVTRQMLHAATLCFQHPASGKRLTFKAPLPDDMEALLARCRAM